MRKYSGESLRCSTINGFSLVSFAAFVCFTWNVLVGVRVLSGSIASFNSFNLASMSSGSGINLCDFDMLLLESNSFPDNWCSFLSRGLCGSPTYSIFRSAAMDETEADFQFFSRLVGTFAVTSAETPDTDLPKAAKPEAAASLSELRARLQAQLDKSKARRQGKTQKLE